MPQLDTTTFVTQAVSVVLVVALLYAPLTAGVLTVATTALKLRRAALTGLAQGLDAAAVQQRIAARRA